MQMQTTKQTKSELGYNKWRDYDLLTCLIAMVGLLLTITDYEYTFQRMVKAFPSATIYDTQEERD